MKPAGFRIPLLTVLAPWIALLPTSVPAATIHVTNLGNGGAGSLRQAILDANAVAGGDIIVFDVGGTINLVAALPPLTDNATEIHGETAPGGSPPRVTLNATGLNYGIRI